MRIEDIVDAIRHNRIRITDHADEEAQVDRLSFDEIFFSVFLGEVINGAESYYGARGFRGSQRV